MARSERAAHSDKNQPPIDSTLASRLVAAFGPQCLRHEMELLLAIEPLYRHVPGTITRGKVTRMSATEYHLVLHLWSAWWSGGEEEPWPSVAEMAARLQKSERQVQRLLAALKKKGFLTSEGRHAQDGQQRANRYDFTPFLLRIVEMLEKKGQDTTSQAKAREGRHE